MAGSANSKFLVRKRTASHALQKEKATGSLPSPAATDALNKYTAGLGPHGSAPSSEVMTGSAHMVLCMSFTLPGDPVGSSACGSSDVHIARKKADEASVARLAGCDQRHASHVAQSAAPPAAGI